MRWTWHVAQMGEKKNAYRILVGKPEGKRPVGRPRRRWVDIINYDQFSVLCANTCQFFKFTFKFLKLLKFLTVLKITTCFGQYGHPQVLKSSGGNCCYSAAIACVPLTRTYVVLGVLCSLLLKWILER
jgi:hypothetical protein